MLALNLNIS